MAEFKEKSGKAPRRRGRRGKSQQKEEVSQKQLTNTSNNNNNSGGSYDEETQQGIISASGTFKPHQTLLIHLTEETPTWYECGRHTQHRNDTILSITKNKKRDVKTTPPHIVSKYRSLADSIYRQEVTLHRSASNKNYDKDEQWVENTMKRGTLKDRIAAMSVVVSSHPVHKLYALDMLLNLAGVATGDDNASGSQTNDRVGHMASEALTDLFTSTLLPPNRKLIGLDARPLYLYEEGKSKLSISPRILLLWRYEEIIKNKYTAFLTQYLGRTLAQSGSSSLELTKINCLRTACALLKEIPEGEQTLLGLAVNKIGDPSKKVAAAAAHELRRILEVHPNMMNIIAREVQQLAHRPNLSPRALYNCIIFLNQLKLVKEDESPENNDGEDEEEESASKKVKQASLERSSLPASLINTYFQIFEVAVNKSKVSSKKSKKAKEAAKMDLAMKGRLLGALLTGVNRAHPYLPTKDTGMEKHVDSLYRIAHVSPPAACTQALMLLFHLAVGSSTDENNGGQLQSSEKKKNKEEAKIISSRKDRFYRVLYSKLADPTMFAGRQLTLFFNLLYKAMKYDDNSLRVVAFAKRLIHMAFHQTPSVVSGALFLVSEVMKHQPHVESGIFSAQGHGSIFDPLKREPSAAFTENDSELGDDKDTMQKNSTSVDAASLWEVALTLNHYHPTVCKFSSSMNEITYRGDPLRDFTLAPFLDKFAFKNPKSLKKIRATLRRGESVGERRSGLQGNVQALSSLPVNDPDFWKKGNSISEQEEFFEKFFIERAKRDTIKGIVRGKKNEEYDPFEEAEDREIDTLGVGSGGKEVDFNWETDDEEEAFVEKLAESLMESGGDGKAVLDDEDPDMDDWSDYDGSDSENEVDDREFEDFDSNEGDEDEDDDIDDPFIKVQGALEEDESSLEGDNELEMSFVTDDMSSEDDQNESQTDTNQKKTKQSSTALFADASEYEELIDESLIKEAGSKRTALDLKLDEEDETANNSEKKSKKRRRRSRASKKK